MIPQSEVESSEWIIQRCLQERKGIELLYQDWMVRPMRMVSSRLVVVSEYDSDDLMTKAELTERLARCHKQWPDHEFRGHNVVNCRCKDHVRFKRLFQ